MRPTAPYPSALAVALAIAVGLSACHAGSSRRPAASGAQATATPSLATPQTERSAEALQWCVDRWNQMRPTWPPTLAIVSASDRRCEIALAESYPADRSTCSRPARPLPGAPGICVSRAALFPCAIQRTGAYACPQHGELGPSERRGWNATIDSDRRLVLDHPPQAWSQTPLPRWAAVYPHVDGFILPWRAGRLRAGLSLTGAAQGTCLRGGSESPRAAGALRCFTGNLVIDPCFPGAGSRRQGPVIVACPYGPGSTRFVRLLIRR